MKFAYGLLALAAMVGACATQGTKEAYTAAPLRVIKTNASIPFFNLHHRIDNWIVRKDGSLLLKTDTGLWYHATIQGPCPDLPFAEHLAFKGGPDGELNKFSSVFVQHQQCFFDTLDQVENPAAAVAAS